MKHRRRPRPCASLLRLVLVSAHAESPKRRRFVHPHPCRRDVRSQLIWRQRVMCRSSLQESLAGAVVGAKKPEHKSRFQAVKVGLRVGALTATTNKLVSCTGTRHLRQRIANRLSAM